MKKIIILAIFLTIIFFIRPTTGYANIVAITISDGDLVKSSNSSSIYLISGTTRQIFPHLSVYESWGYPLDFSTVKTIPLAKLYNYIEGEPVPFRDGSLFRGTTISLHGKDASAVFVISDGKLRAIQSAEVYQFLYNDPKWNKIIWVPDDLLDKFEYTLGETVNSSDIHPDGSLIQYNGSPSVYLIKNGVKREITTNAFISNRLQTKNIILVDIEKYNYNDGSDIINTERLLIDPTYSSKSENNQKPIITGIYRNQIHSSNEETIYKYYLNVQAYDPEGDTLTYTWRIDCGYILGNIKDTDTIEWRHYATTNCQEVWATVSVTDSNGLSTTKTQNIFSLSNIPDINPPIFTSVGVIDTKPYSITITWTTDELSNSFIEYGTIQNNYTFSIKEDENVIDHKIALSNLLSNKTYHYRVCSTDTNSNTGCTRNITFITAKRINATGTISIAKDDDSPPSSIIIDNFFNNVISKIRFTTTNEYFNITKLRVKLKNINNSRYIDMINIAYPSHSVSGYITNGYVDFTGLDWTIEADSYEVLSISANFTDFTPQTDINSREIQLGIDVNDGAQIIGEFSGSKKFFDAYDGDAFGNIMYLAKSKPTITIIDIVKPQLLLGTNIFLKFKISADSAGPITIKKLKFNITDNTPQTLITITDWKLYDTNNGTWSDGINTSITGKIPVSNDEYNISIEFDDEIEIIAGSSKTFEFKGLISEIEDFDDVLDIKLTNEGDTAIINGGLKDHETELVKLDINTDELSVDFLWSDKASGNNHTDDYQNIYMDWSNGYLVEGFTN